MNTPRLLLTSLFCLACSHTAQPQALWQGTTYGMSVEQVRNTVPTSAPPKGKPEHLGNGAEELLRVEDIELVNQRFSASFFFAERKLVQVTLSLRKGPSYDTAMLVFDALADALRSKYGPQLSDRSNNIGITKTRKADWVSGRTNVTMFALTVGDTPATLNVNYQVRLAKDADKL